MPWEYDANLRVGWTNREYLDDASERHEKYFESVNKINFSPKSVGLLPPHR